MSSQSVKTVSPTLDFEIPDKKSPQRPRWPKLTVSAIFGGIIILLALLAAVFGPAFAPFDPSALISTDSWASPSAQHWFGTDMLGRDLFSRFLYGARYSIGIAFLASSLALIVGASFGIWVSVSGGWLDNIFCRINDLFMAFPPLILALLVIAGLGSSLSVLVGTMAFIDATRIFRISRSVAMEIVAMDYVEVARARGESRWWIMRREVLPNITTSLTAEFGIRFVFAVLFLSSLSFFGLGIQPPAADWGSLVKENIQALILGSWAPVYPATAIGLLAVGVNFLVDWWNENK